MRNCRSGYQPLDMGWRGNCEGGDGECYGLRHSTAGELRDREWLGISTEDDPAVHRVSKEMNRVGT